MAFSLKTQLGDGPQLDAFGRLRIGSPESLFASGFSYNLNPLIWEQVTGTGGTVTHVPGNSAAQLAATGSSGSIAAVQSYQHSRYYPGRSQSINLTTAFGSAVANVRRRAGYFSSTNGVFFEQNGTTDVAAVVRSDASGSPVDTRIVQDSWNLDKLDGTGPSGITLDLSKAQIFHFDAQWLGVGRVRFGFVIAGTIVYVHQVLNANVVTASYTRHFSLPIRYEIESTGASAGASMLAMCSNVICEGGQHILPGLTFAASNGITTIGVTTRRAILSIRPKATLNSIINRILIDVTRLEAYGDASAFVELVYKPTFTGTPTWTSANAESGTEFSVHNDGAAGAITGGTVIESFFVTLATGAASRGSKDVSVLSKYPLTLDAAGANPAAVSLVATSFSGTANCSAAISWKETR